MSAIPLPYVVPEQSKPSLPTPEAFEALKAELVAALQANTSMVQMLQAVSEELGEHADVEDGSDGQYQADWCMRLRHQVDLELEGQGVRP